MASFLRPRRGKNSTAVSTLTSSNPLKRGEIFFEVPDGGVGTGQGRLFMGDGSTAYSSLTPFLSIPDATIPSFATAQDTDAKRLTKIATGVKFSELFSNLKALLTSFDSRITTLNNDLSTKQNKLSATGSTTKPVYVSSSGTVTACSGTVGSTTNPVYMNAGTMTACTGVMTTSTSSGTATISSTYTVKEDSSIEYFKIGRIVIARFVVRMNAAGVGTAWTSRLVGTGLPKAVSGYLDFPLDSDIRIVARVDESGNAYVSTRAETSTVPKDVYGSVVYISAS